MGNMWSKQENEEKGFTLVELIIVIVILGVISGVALPKFVGLSDSARTSAARGVGRALDGTIAVQHSQFLITTTAYNAGTVVNSTHLGGGITAPSVSGSTITLNSGPRTYSWTFTSGSSSASAFITEDSSSDFP